MSSPGKVKKVYGSESAFMWGRQVFTDYATGCLRKIYLRSRGVRSGDVIDPKHKIRGTQFENQYEQRLLKQGSPFTKEQVIRYKLDSHPDFEFSGRADYVVDTGAVKIVDELKSTESKNQLRQIKARQYSQENLAQTIAYMLAIGTDRGRLVRSYLELSGETYVPKAEHSFEILINDYGRILVDNKPTKFTIYDQMAHQAACADVIENDVIFDRPYGHNNAFGSPCSYCPFKGTCDMYDKKELQSVEEYVEVARDALIGVKGIVP